MGNPSKAPQRGRGRGREAPPEHSEQRRETNAPLSTAARGPPRLRPGPKSRPRGYLCLLSVPVIKLPVSHAGYYPVCKCRLRFVPLKWATAVSVGGSERSLRFHGDRPGWVLGPQIRHLREAVSSAPSASLSFPPRRRPRTFAPKERGAGVKFSSRAPTVLGHRVTFWAWKRLGPGLCSPGPEGKHLGKGAGAGLWAR